MTGRHTWTAAALAVCTVLLLVGAVTWSLWLALPAPLVGAGAYAAWLGLSWGRFVDAVDGDGTRVWPL